MQAIHKANPKKNVADEGEKEENKMHFLLLRRELCPPAILSLLW
jgi:hypothetical protein